MSFTGFPPFLVIKEMGKIEISDAKEHLLGNCNFQNINCSEMKGFSLCFRTRCVMCLGRCGVCGGASARCHEHLFPGQGAPREGSRGQHQRGLQKGSGVILPARRI